MDKGEEHQPHLASKRGGGWGGGKLNYMFGKKEKEKALEKGNEFFFLKRGGKKEMKNPPLEGGDPCGVHKGRSLCREKEDYQSEKSQVLINEKKRKGWGKGRLGSLIGGRKGSNRGRGKKKGHGREKGKTHRGGWWFSRTALGKRKKKNDRRTTTSEKKKSLGSHLLDQLVKKKKKTLNNKGKPGVHDPKKKKKNGHLGKDRKKRKIPGMKKRMTLSPPTYTEKEKEVLKRKQKNKGT